MKRLILFLSILVFPLLGQTATPPAAGDGSVGDPYQLATLENLYWLSQNSDKWDSNFVQTADIDASASEFWDGGQGFSPLGNADTPFSGSYEGLDFTISGLYIDRQELNDVGLFGVTSGATITEVRIWDATIYGNSNTAILVGSAEDASSLSDNIVFGTVSGNNSVAGLVGYLNNSNLSYSVSYASISGNYYTGSVIGQSFASTISQCAAYGFISGNQYCGGFAGYMIDNSHVTNCYSQANVYAQNNSVGGFAGQIGFFFGLETTITNCYSSGSVTSATGTSSIAGFVGRTRNTTLTDCYWDTETSGYSSGGASSGLTGYTTAQMQQSGNYNNWGFLSFWDINSDHYPHLRIQPSGGSLEPVPITLNATSVLGSSVSINGGVVPNDGSAEYYFEYGTSSTSLTDQIPLSPASAGDGFNQINVSADLTGLDVDTKYFYRLVTKRTAGDPVYGDIREFDTRPVETTIPLGAGTSGDPYQLSSLANLAWLTFSPETWDDYFVMTDDIDASGTTSWYSGAGFVPIGSESSPFSGNFDGDNYTISGLYINRPDDDNIGLFGYTDFSADPSHKIENVIMTDADISGFASIGMLVGYMYGSTIENCHVSGAVSGTTESYNLGVGGLTGTAGSSAIYECSSSGQVSGARNAGGLLGYDNRSDIQRCFSSADVNGAYSVGGFTGSHNYDTPIQNCYSTGNVSGDYDVGGFVGSLGVNITVLRKCYSLGTVTGSYDFGGFAGTVTAGVTITGCFWNTTTSGISSPGIGNGSGDVQGKTTAQMQMQSTFTAKSWSFPDPWKIATGSFPYLAWQEDPGAAPTVSINSVGGISFDSADLSGNINPNGGSQNTTYWFLYGEEVKSLTATDTTDIGNGTAPISVEETLNSLLSPNTRYYVQLVAENATGKTASDVIAFYTTPYYKVPDAGDGSGSPYQIDELSELAWLMLNSNQWNKNYILTNSSPLDASETADWNQGLGWDPVGKLTYFLYPNYIEGNPFTGNFDGNGKTIANLTINRPDEENVGLFGFCRNATVSDVFLTNVNITGNARTGGLAGIVINTDLSGHSVTGTVTGQDGAGSYYIGGLAGAAYTSTILSATVDVDISAPNGIAGALIGYLYHDNAVSECYAFGNISGGSTIGGLIGSCSGSSISQCFASVTIEGISNLGGLAGYATRYSYSSTDIYSSIVNSYAASNISGSSGGGLVGSLQYTSVTNSYSASTLDMTGTVGGLVGSVGTDGTQSNSFWDNTIAPYDNGIGTAKTTAEMKTMSTFTNAGWDFTIGTGIWGINADYPYLQWQAPGEPVSPIVTTGQADSITTTSAFVEGTVNPRGSETTYIFYFGTRSGIYPDSLPVSPQSIGAGFGNINVSVTLGSLTPDRTYYYRLMAKNIAGVSYGEELSFKTATALSPPPGSGTALDPYLVSTLEHLYWLTETSAAWSSDFRLMKDLNLAETQTINNGLGWSPIGNGSAAFTGYFDGNDHQLNNLYINRPDENYVGFFGKLDGATVTGLGVNGNITGKLYVGLLAGFAGTGASLSVCTTSGQVAGSSNCGGFAGWIESASTLTDCYSSGDVSGLSKIGGLVGLNLSSTITRCFSIGQVSGNTDLGGLVGKSSSGTVISSFWDTQTSAQSGSAGGTGRSTLQMKRSNTYSDWDLDVTWRIYEFQSYPYLGWERLEVDFSISVPGTGAQVIAVGNRSGIDQFSFNNVTTPGNVSVQYLTDIPANAESIDGVVSQYRWVIEPDELIINEAAGYSLRFNLADLYGFGGINEYTGADPNVSDIRLYKRDTPGSGAFAVVPGFLEYYNNGTIGDQRDDYLISPLITDGFSEFVFATEGDHPLPVELSTFRATGKDRQVELFWKTASELLNSGFNVYRSDSEEGEYQEISSYRYNEDLEGLGTSAHGQDYRFTDNDFRLLNDATYYYKIADVDVNGVITMHGPVTATPTASEADEQVARLFKLYPNYPNPFNPTTTIVVDLEEFTDEALIEVYDITGRLVKTLYSGPINQYRIMVEWDGTNNAGNTLSTGMYFYRYRSANRDIMRKMILMK
jgi:hypothetical protein